MKYVVVGDGAHGLVLVLMGQELDSSEAGGQIANVSKRSPFIVPAAPVLKLNPPTGPQWIHECKFDGWRGQLSKAGDDVVVFSRNGKDITSRFRAIAHSLRVLPAKAAIIDCELVACDSDGMPSFAALMAGGHTLCA